MSKNLKKFVNPRFTRTTDLDLLRRLLERHKDDLRNLDLSVFEGDPGIARAAVEAFFAGREENYPEALVTDLHRIAELGDANGLRLIQEQAARNGVRIGAANDDGPPDAHQEPKQVALRVFLEQPALFNAAADKLSYSSLSSFAEFAGKDEGVEARVDEQTRSAFKSAAGEMFASYLRGNYCRVGWYDDDDEINIVVTHGAAFRTTEVIVDNDDQVISFREAEHGVLAYSAATGRLRVGGIAKARRTDLAEIFAATMLQQPGFFAAPDAQDLYTLAPIEQAGFGFAMQHSFDPGIRSVRIVEAQLDRIGIDPRSGQSKSLWSHTVRDYRDNALRRFGDTMIGIRFGADWRLNHLVLHVDFDTGAPRPTRVTVKLKPPGIALFKRHRFEGRIMTLLRRNGLAHDREPGRAAAAAE